MVRLLVVSDDWGQKRALKSGLLERGLRVAHATSAQVFEDAFAPEPADLVIVDLERCATEPGKLLAVLHRERSLKELPFILLVPETQLGRLDFRWGIDDYLTLPVSPQRLAERLNFLLWKLHRVELKNGIAHGTLTIDFDRYEVRVKGEPVDLTFKEFELLRFLATHPGRVFSREALLDKVWGYDYYGGTRTVDVHVRRLRAKVEVGGATYIETVRNVGYKFLGPDVA